MNASDARILCVDDQVEITNLFERQLSDDFDCTFVTSAQAALEAARTNGPYAVIVTDYAMPGMDGVQLLSEIGRHSPETIGVMVTAFHDLDIAVSALHEGNIFRFIRKPWNADELLHAVHEAVAYFRLRRNERLLREQLARINADLDEKVQEVDEANDLLEYWVEFSPAVLYSASYDGGILRPNYISKNFRRLTGVERTAAIIDESFWRMHVHPRDVDDYDEVIAKLLRGEQTHAIMEYRIRHTDGNDVRILDSVRAIQDGDGDTLELVGAWLDISARP